MRHFIKEGWMIGHAQIKHALRRGTHSDLPINIQSWKCVRAQGVIQGKLCKPSENSSYQPETTLPICLIVLPSINMLLSTRFAYYHLDWHGSWWYTGLQSMLIHLIQSRIQSLCHICLKPETRQKSSQVRRRVWATLIWVR